MEKIICRVSGIWSRKCYNRNDLEKPKIIRTLEQKGSRIKRLGKRDRSNVDEALLKVV